MFYNQNVIYLTSRTFDNARLFFHRLFTVMSATDRTSRYAIWWIKDPGIIILLGGGKTRSVSGNRGAAQKSNAGKAIQRNSAALHQTDKQFFLFFFFAMLECKWYLQCLSVIFIAEVDLFQWYWNTETILYKLMIVKFEREETTYLFNTLFFSDSLTCAIILWNVQLVEMISYHIIVLVCQWMSVFTVHN